MEFKAIDIPGAYLIKLTPFIDERGIFTRLFCKNELKQIGFDQDIKQINHSYNKQKGTLRGMHFQHAPYGEKTIIRCMQGSVYDVMVDMRQGSPTFLQYYGIELSPEAYNAVYIPQGCAHGFQTLADNCQLLYLHSEFYYKAGEGGIRYDDPIININWPLPPLNVSDKDMSFPLLNKNFQGITI
jgi:dTDP-4-dehydrorhamnose 3,5-epimerase